MVRDPQPSAPRRGQQRRVPQAEQSRGLPALGLPRVGVQGVGDRLRYAELGGRGQPVDPGQFWRESRVSYPAMVRVTRSTPAAEGEDWRELELEAESWGPGSHPGSSRMFATAHVRRTQESAPMVILVHGFAVPFTGYDRWQAWRMRQMA